MPSKARYLRFTGLALGVVCLAAILLPTYASGGENEKQYPIQGKVTARAITSDIFGGKDVTTTKHRVYTVQTSNRTYVLECEYWLNGIHIHSARECGGSKAIQLGDLLHFRIENDYAYVQTDKGEDRLDILSEAIIESAP